ncbi:hypothetical protein [Sulfitobacter sp. M22]|uniref:hypothetical protein n=1 Tax=Sulfitobacter sp. M22 TaxID=2675332 RepID=UPI001F1D14CB|nr:hypothetical protein [Sulfitobacter sp. M22]MCF7725796.1 hypothetical protein [Sulfitobacter sp. M22]
MLTALEFKRDVLNPILDSFLSHQTLANSYCIIWAIDSYATHVALDNVEQAKDAESLENNFKRKLSTAAWEFRVIKEASNATKHGIRKIKVNAKHANDVLRSSDVRPDKGKGFYAWFSRVDGGTTIETDWIYRKEEKAYFDSMGEKVNGYRGIGPTIYLSEIIHPAIDAIDAIDAEMQVSKN